MSKVIYDDHFMNEQNIEKITPELRVQAKVVIRKKRKTEKRKWEGRE